MRRFTVHKDSAPAATVRKIKRLLLSIGLRPVEKNIRFSGSCYSARLEHPEMCVGTNGKGVSRAFARASAYAELMERTQTATLFRTRFGCMPAHDDLFPDAKSMDTKSCLAEMRPILKEMCDGSPAIEAVLARALGKTVVALPYYCVSDDSIVYLPTSLLNEALGTNGLCAGNTAEEAIAQGLCEVIERHALRLILVNQEPAPTVPHADLRSLRSYKIIDQITKLGFSVVVKDCTLGGQLPVMGILLLNRDCTKYRVAFGADPLLDVALQRCLTEVAQNYDCNTIESVMKDLRPVLDQDGKGVDKRHVHLEYIKAFMNGEGSFHREFLLARGRPRHREAFLPRMCSHREMLGWLVDKVHRLSKRLYIRSFSFLGFPTYRVYVPGLSELRRFDEAEVESELVDKAKIRHYLLRIPELSRKQVRDCVRLLEGRASQFSIANYSTYSGLQLRPGSDLFEMDLDWLSTFLCLRVGDYAKAYRHLDAFLKSGLVESFGGYIMGALLYLRERSEGRSDRDARKTLSSLFGSRRAVEVASDLSNRRSALHDLRLPICGNCSTCPARRDCYYPRWTSLLLSMKREFAKHPIDQAKSLAHVFS